MSTTYEPGSALPGSSLFIRPAVYAVSVVAYLLSPPTTAITQGPAETPVYFLLSSVQVSGQLHLQVQLIRNINGEVILQHQPVNIATLHPYLNFCGYCNWGLEVSPVSTTTPRPAHVNVSTFLMLCRPIPFAYSIKV